MLKKKLPWVSLVLLLATYDVLGWLLSANPNASWIVWVGAGSVALLIAAALTSALPLVRDLIGFTLESDVRAFVVVTIAAFLSVFLITWINASARALIMISAESLARLELQIAGFNQWQAFGILSTLSLAGLGLGGLTHALILHRLTYPTL